MCFWSSLPAPRGNPDSAYLPFVSHICIAPHKAAERHSEAISPPNTSRTAKRPSTTQPLFSLSSRTLLRSVIQFSLDNRKHLPPSHPPAHRPSLAQPSKNARCCMRTAVSPLSELCLSECEGHKSPSSGDDDRPMLSEASVLSPNRDALSDTTPHPGSTQPPQYFQRAP